MKRVSIKLRGEKAQNKHEEDINAAKPGKGLKPEEILSVVIPFFEMLVYAKIPLSAELLFDTNDEHYEQLKKMWELALKSQVKPADEKEITDMDKKILFYLAKGKTAEEVGNIVHLSKHTVYNHLKPIYEETGIHKLRELIVYAYLRHWIAG